MRITLIIIILLVSGCAAYPKDRTAQTSYHLKQAESAISKDDCTRAVVEINHALSRPTGQEKSKILFDNNVKISDCYYSALETLSKNPSSLNQADLAHSRIVNAFSTGLITKDKEIYLLDNLEQAVAADNLNNSIPFLIGNNLSKYPILMTDVHQRIIFERTLDILKEGVSKKRPVKELIEHAISKGYDSVEWTRLTHEVENLNIRSDEIDLIENHFPEYAALRRTQMEIKIHLVMVNGDRLVRDDISNRMLKLIKGISIVDNELDSDITIEVDQVRNIERAIPESTQTITYAQHQVNIAAAVLLMPRNASYLYEVKTSGSEIEYGYVIKAIKNDQQTYEKVLRGTLESKHKECQNARIQNVFGGVSSAGFVANADMSSRCAGSKPTTIQSLREQVASRVANEILKIPEVKKIHNLH